MTAPSTILIVDDEPMNRKLLEALLRPEGYRTRTAASGLDALASVMELPPDLILLDVMMPGMNGYAVARTLKGDPATAGIPIVMLSARRDPDGRLQGLEAGAEDFLTKPVDLRQFRAVVASALGRMASGTGAVALPVQTAHTAHNAHTAARSAPTRRTALERLLGESAAMQQVRSLVEKVARSMAPVLVHGESGTGKELVARAIHDCSPRAAGPFVAVNCGAIPEALLERNSSATARARSPAPTKTAKAFSRLRRAARSFSTRSATCRWPCRASCCA